MSEPTGLFSFYKSMQPDEMVNQLYNQHVASVCDSPEGTEKRIPYMGWFWRNTDFVGKHISIGRHRGFVGVMESNKWGYDEREMTPEEVDTFIGFIDTAAWMEARGGNVGDNAKDAARIYAQMRKWFESLATKGDWRDGC